MLRPILVAAALAQCWADCSPGTCQSLEPYFYCDLDGRSNAGGGSTISYADCKGIQIVVRTSLALPLRIVQPKDENIFVFKVANIMKRLNVFQNNITNVEERFVVKALLIAFQSDRQYRRLIPKSEVMLEQMWGKVAKWKADLVFGVASPAASCEFCLRMPVQVYEMNSAYNIEPVWKQWQTAVHVSVIKQVMPVQLASLPLRDLLVFLIGYAQDLTAFANGNLWHDCHLGNLLMQQEAGQYHFYWHDFGGVSSGIHPKAEALQDFVRKMGETIAETAKMISTLDSRVNITEPTIEATDTVTLKRQLAEFSHGLRIEVMRSAASQSIRKAVLLSLSRALSRTIYEELEYELKSDLAQA